MNAEDKKRFEQLKHWIHNSSIPHQLELMWLCSKVEELEVKVAGWKKLACCDHGTPWDTNCQECITADRSLAPLVNRVLNLRVEAQLAKVKAQRDRLADALKLALGDVGCNCPRSWPRAGHHDTRCIAYYAAKALAELEKDT